MTDAHAEPSASRAASDLNLGRSTAVMAAGTLISRVTGFGRIFALAYAIGANDLAGTYTLANVTPNIVYELVLGGVLSGTLLAVFVDRLATRSEEEAWSAISAVISLAVVVAAAAAAIFVVIAPWFIRLYTLRTSGELAADQLAVATDLLRLFAPQVLFYGLVSLSTAVLNAQRRFAAPMWAPILNNLVVIAVLLAFPAVSDTTTLAGVRGDWAAIALLGLGTTAGVVVQAAAQVPWTTVRRHLRWVWAPRHETVGTVLRLSGWTAAWVVANQVALFVVYFLANADPADVAIYNWAYIIFLLPHGIVAVSLMTALAPELAERWSQRDADGFRGQLSLGLRTILATMAPAAAGYVVLAAPIVALLLQHGRLSPAAADDVAATLALMALGLPAFSSWLFLTRAYQALQDTRTLFVLYVIENAINVAAALVFYPRFGVRGLGLALAIAYIGGTLVALGDLRRRIGGVDGRHLLSTAARVAAAVAAMVAAVVLVASAVGGRAGGEALVRVTAGVATGVTVYAAGALLLGVRELTGLVPTRRGT